jgi:SAM-dependent methyltransferase
MEEQERLARRRQFGAAAAAYDAVRPGYPAGIVEVLIARAGLGRASEVLEIGCGTGQLTRDLAPTGCAIVCLEPSAELACLARRNLARFPNVRVQEATFECFEPVPSTFDLVVAATSFHWVDPRVRCQRPHQTLRPGGLLGVLTNAHPGPWTGFFERVQDVYGAVAPELTQTGERGQTETWADDLASELAASGLFAQTEAFSERWQKRFGRDDYLALLSTFSPHRQLPEDQRERLFAAIGRLIDEEYGGYVEQPYSTILCLARKAL